MDFLLLLMRHQRHISARQKFISCFDVANLLQLKFQVFFICKILGRLCLLHASQPAGPFSFSAFLTVRTLTTVNPTQFLGFG